jgi:hypothetical protein
LQQLTGKRELLSLKMHCLTLLMAQRWR